MFVAAEPFDESLLFSIEQGQGNSNKHECLGSCVIHLKDVERRIDATPTPMFGTILRSLKNLKLKRRCPLSMFQLDSLRNQAAGITILRFRRAAPPLSKEAVEFMLDIRANVWSMRR
ncbi:hypothetical protein TSUD_90850 [Trifolium subterraneum]|uniref:Uncharacterized protein n=1 Tax=Trifolium subterraneum TaxID=3900 RepID=A0A2Z6PDV9_TRISU|nr:hypothetical protein TSUD_90850 [Trifolium subterraneum]